MIAIPARVWRGGPLRGGLTVGGGLGLFFGALAWLDSGMPVIGLIVLVALTIGLGLWTARRMTRYWPGSRDLTGAQRVAVAAAARGGLRIGEPALAPAVVDYSRGLHAAAQDERWRHWLVVVLLVVAIGSSLWDAVLGSWGNAIVSFVYLVLVGLELFWWPKRRTQLLTNTEKAVALL